MSLTVHHERHNEYVCIIFAGTPALVEFLEALSAAGVDSKGCACNVMLIELRQVQTKFTFAEQVSIGEVGGSNFSHLCKVALLLQGTKRGWARRPPTAGARTCACSRTRHRR